MYILHSYISDKFLNICLHAVTHRLYTYVILKSKHTWLCNRELELIFFSKSGKENFQFNDNIMYVRIHTFFSGGWGWKEKDRLVLIFFKGGGVSRSFLVPVSHFEKKILFSNSSFIFSWYASFSVSKMNNVLWKF